MNSFEPGFWDCRPEQVYDLRRVMARFLSPIITCTSYISVHPFPKAQVKVPENLLISLHHTWHVRPLPYPRQLPNYVELFKGEGIFEILA